MDAVVRLAREIREIRHAQFAADDRNDDKEVMRLGMVWHDLEAREEATAPTTLAGALQKLRNGAATAQIDPNDICQAFARRVDRIATRIERQGIAAGDLIELRAQMTIAAKIDAEIETSIAETLASGINWLAKPKLVDAG